MPGSTAWGAVLTTFALGVVGAMQVGRVAPAAPALDADLGLGLAPLGWAISLITLATAVAGLPAGHAVARSGARRGIAAGMLVLALCVALGALAPGPLLLLAARAAEGFGYLALVVAAPTLIARLTQPRDAAMALALWGTFFTTGLSLSALAGGWASDVWGWRGWYAANAALLVLAALLAWRALPRDLPPPTPRAAEATPAGIGRAAPLLGLAFLGVTMLSLAVLSMLPTFLVEIRQATPAAAGATTAAVALTSIAGSLGYGALAERLGRPVVVGAALLLLAVAGFPAFLAALPPAAGVALAALAVGASGVMVAHAFASVPRLVGDARRIAPANGLLAQLGSIGALLGPPAVGALVSAAGWAALGTLIVVATALSAVLMVASERAAAH